LLCKSEYYNKLIHKNIIEKKATERTEVHTTHSNNCGTIKSTRYHYSKIFISMRTIEIKDVCHQEWPTFNCFSNLRTTKPTYCSTDNNVMLRMIVSNENKEQQSDILPKWKLEIYVPMSDNNELITMKRICSTTININIINTDISFTTAV